MISNLYEKKISDKPVLLNISELDNNCNSFFSLTSKKDYLVKNNHNDKSDSHDGYKVDTYLRNHNHHYEDNIDNQDNEEELDEYDTRPQLSEGEKSLWRSVITQALMDAGTKSQKKEMIKAKNEAISWFDIDNDDFINVCIMADMDPHYVLTKSKQAIARGCTWRNDPAIRKPHPFAKKKGRK